MTPSVLPRRWPPSQLDLYLASGQLARTEIDCGSQSAAISLRNALYTRRKRCPEEVRVLTVIRVRGTVLVIEPANILAPVANG